MKSSPCVLWTQILCLFLSVSKKAIVYYIPSNFIFNKSFDWKKWRITNTPFSILLILKNIEIYISISKSLQFTTVQKLLTLFIIIAFLINWNVQIFCD